MEVNQHTIIFNSGYKYLVKLQSPKEVNIIEWALERPNCDALIEKDNHNGKTMTVIAYAVNETGNTELNKFASSHNNVGIFGGIDTAMLNHVGELI